MTPRPPTVFFSRAQSISMTGHIEVLSLPDDFHHGALRRT
jgi:hypothetical protein